MKPAEEETKGENSKTDKPARKPRTKKADAAMEESKGDDAHADEAAGDKPKKQR